MTNGPGLTDEDLEKLQRILEVNRECGANNHLIAGSEKPEAPADD